MTSRAASTELEQTLARATCDRQGCDPHPCHRCLFNAGATAIVTERLIEEAIRHVAEGLASLGWTGAAEVVMASLDNPDLFDEAIAEVTA